MGNNKEVLRKELNLLLLTVKSNIETTKILLNESAARLADYRLLGLEVSATEVAHNDKLRTLLEEYKEDEQLILARLQHLDSAILFYPEDNEKPASNNIAYYIASTNTYSLTTNLDLKGKGIKKIGNNKYLLTAEAYKQLCKAYVIYEKMYLD